MINELVARTRLAKALAYLYEKQTNQVVILQMAGFHPTQFTLLDNAEASWVYVLGELHKNQYIPQLLQAVKQPDQYPQNTDLLQTELLWRISQADIAETRWRNVYQLSCTQLVGKHPVAHDLPDAIAYLWGKGQQSNGRIPVLDFAASVAHQVADALPQIAADVNNWAVETASSYWHVDHYDIDLYVLEESEPRAKQAYLQLLLDPDSANINRMPQDYRFNLDVLWWDHRQYPQKLYASERYLRFEEILAALKQILNGGIDAYADENTELAIECFLPAEIIAQLFTHSHKGDYVHAIDQWLVHGRRTPIKCGDDYPVVLRLRERTIGRSIKQKKLWHKRWQMLQSHDPERCREMALWLTDDEIQNQLDLLEADENVAFVGARFAPTDLDTLQEILDALLETGTPVALLPRMCADTTVADHLQRHVHSAHLDELPKTIKCLRQAAKTDPSHAGNHLTLLWDEPNRIPPQEYISLVHS